MVLINAINITDFDSEQLLSADLILSSKQGKGLYTYAIKSTINYKDFNCNASSIIIENYKPSYTSTVCKKLDSANHFCKFVVLSDSHNMGIGNNSVLTHYNSKIIGGSSSGPAVILHENNTIDYSLGTDTAGSIVLPSVQMQLWAFKPSKGCISRYGVHEYCPLFDRVCILSKSLNVLNIVYNIIKGVDVRDSFTEHYKEKDFINIKIYKLFEEADFEIPYFKLDLTNIEAKYKLILHAYAYSALNRYDGVRFNKSLFTAENNLEEKTKNRNKGFTKLIKNRILNGYKAIEQLDKKELLIDQPLYNPPIAIYIQKHYIAYSYEQISKNEYSYALANIFNYCSIVVPKGEYSLEFLAPSGYEAKLFEVVKKYV
jgi:Asp-tRNA(Asn)/Glu-tRNA(Gln) amidotransferase A subunit family amidase